MPTSSASETLNALLTATNTHDFSNVRDLLAEGAVYYFSDATLIGRDAVGAYFESTWNTIRDEHYSAEDIQWLVDTDRAAVAIYRYRWSGLIDGQLAEGSGRATNAFARDGDGRWLLTHEHLSPPPNA